MATTTTMPMRPGRPPKHAPPRPKFKRRTVTVDQPIHEELTRLTDKNPNIPESAIIRWCLKKGLPMLPDVLQDELPY